MNEQEAIAWLRGERSWTNIIPRDYPDGLTWTMRISQADAASTEQAYWTLRAIREGLVTAQGGDGERGASDE